MEHRGRKRLKSVIAVGGPSDVRRLVVTTDPTSSTRNRHLHKNPNGLGMVVLSEEILLNDVRSRGIDLSVVPRFGA
jgi:hypothetical protein